MKEDNGGHGIVRLADLKVFNLVSVAPGMSMFSVCMHVGIHQLVEFSYPV